MTGALVTHNDSDIRELAVMVVSLGRCDVIRPGALVRWNVMRGSRLGLVVSVDPGDRTFTVLWSRPA